MITVINRRSKIVRSNPAAEHLLGMTDGAMVARRSSEVFALKGWESMSSVDRLRRGESVEAKLPRSEIVNNTVLAVTWSGRPHEKDGPSGEFAVLFRQGR